jgi:putative transposase
VGWRAFRSPRTDLPLNALAQAVSERIHQETRLGGPARHSEGGVQHLPIRYTGCLAECGVVSSVGSGGNCCDNALAESVFGLYKTELVRNKGPWRCLDEDPT